MGEGCQWLRIKQPADDYPAGGGSWHEVPGKCNQSAIDGPAVDSLGEVDM